MRVLQLVSRVPFPLNDGGSIHSYLTARGLAKAGCEVHMLSINTPKHPTDLKELPAPFKNKEIRLFTVDLDTTINIVDAFVNLFSDKSYHITRFISKDYCVKLEELLKKYEYDVVQLEGIFMAPYVSLIREKSNAKVVLKAHNVEHLIWERLTRQEKNPLRKWYLKILSRRLKKFELESINRLDALIAISEIDLKYFLENGCNVKSFVALPGVEKSWVGEAQNISGAQKFFFIGSMDWMPNREGVEWLLKTVWPKVLEERTDLLLSVAGKKMETKWAKSHSLTGVLVEGQVDDAREFMLQKQVLLVPLFSGSGIRIKILEAMFLGRAVISTKLGVEGLNCKEGEHYLEANNEDEFSEAICDLAKNPQKAKTLSRNAQVWANQHFDNAILIADLIGFYKNLVVE